MFELKRWKLDSCTGTLQEGDREAAAAVIARGKCYGNPRFPEGRSIHTSAVVKAELSMESEQIILTTYSGSQYRLDFGEMDGEVYESTRKNAVCLGLETAVERCFRLWQQKQERTRKWLSGLLRPCELYVKINGNLRVEEAFYRTEQGEVVKAAAGCHIGMFMDSVIVGDWEGIPGKYPYGWRYMIDGSRISCYQWNGLLDAVRIFNEGKDFVLEDSGREVLCKSNELTTVISQGMHTECKNGIPAP